MRQKLNFGRTQLENTEDVAKVPGDDEGRIQPAKIRHTAAGALEMLEISARAAPRRSRCQVQATKR
jgi:hypothetical protein